MSHIFKLFFRGKPSSAQTEKLENIKEKQSDLEEYKFLLSSWRVGKMPRASGSHNPQQFSFCEA